MQSKKYLVRFFVGHLEEYLQTLLPELAGQAPTSLSQQGGTVSPSPFFRSMPVAVNK